jgi:hypothetical protein
LERPYRLQTAVGQLVEHGRALGHPDGMVIGQDAHPEADANALGKLAQGPEQHLRARRAREPREEVMLHEPEIVEARFLGEHALLQRLRELPVDGGAGEGALRLQSRTA